MRSLSRLFWQPVRELRKHGPRIAVTLIPLFFALLHAVGGLRLGVLQHLDDLIYDARLRATMPRLLDERIVIVDFDEKSQAEFGWPWHRRKLAGLVDELFDRQKAALAGFDIVFLEPDESSGLKSLRQLARHELRGQAGFEEAVERLQGALDDDAAFARSLQNQPVVLGYYFTGERDARLSGALPAPVMGPDAGDGRRAAGLSHWNGYGANIEKIAQAAPMAGFFNSITDHDGVMRSLPLVAEHGGQYYEALSLAMFRMLTGLPAVTLGFPKDRTHARMDERVDSVVLRKDGRGLAIQVDERGTALVPFRGPGGARGGSYRYVSAADVLGKRLPPESLKNKIVLIGTTAPGLLDLRVTPVGEIYPGVEMHANVLSGLLDGAVFVRPDYAVGYEVVVLLVGGLVLALTLPRLNALPAVALSVAIAGLVVGLNFWLYLTGGLVLPLASALAMMLAAFALNMSYGYLVESRSKRELAQLFGTYVPPELVDAMVLDPDRYSMKAANRELTVMFCDIRGFTQIAEQMEPVQLQALLNDIFTRLSRLIRAQHGTIDKYMGDCVMAFWGAPVAIPNHATLAVQTASMVIDAVRDWNLRHRPAHLPEIGVGVGINTGNMCVGDMGSDIRRSYTVIGDAVNLGARLEGLCSIYGVDVVVSDATRRMADGFIWQELDKVRVKGKEQAVSIFWPLAAANQLNGRQSTELTAWNEFLKAYRSQNWAVCELQLANLQRLNATKYLYQLYAERVASMKLLSPGPDWDGATSFETK